MVTPTPLTIIRKLKLTLEVYWLFPWIPNEPVYFTFQCSASRTKMAHCFRVTCPASGMGKQRDLATANLPMRVWVATRLLLVSSPLPVDYVHP